MRFLAFATWHPCHSFGVSVRRKPGTCIAARRRRKLMVIMTQGASSTDEGGKPVLVTGATGFIGYHLCTALNRRGYEVHSLSRKSADGDGDDERHHVCDLTAPTELADILRGREWYAIVHLAGLISYAPQDAAMMEAINVRATRALLEEAMRACPRAKFVFCSSVVAVGSNARADDAPVDEEREWDASLEHIAYVRTKRAAEELVRAAGAAGKMATACLCPSNVFGARDALKGSRKSQIKAANGRMSLYTRGGVSIIHVDIVTQAFIKVLETPLLQDDVWKGSRWLITGENVSVRDMLSLCAWAGGNAEYKPWIALPNWLLALICRIGQRLGSKSLTMDRFQLASRYNWYDGSRARKRFELGVASAREAIADSVAWMRQNGLVRPRR